MVDEQRGRVIDAARLAATGMRLPEELSRVNLDVSRSAGAFVPPFPPGAAPLGVQAKIRVGDGQLQRQQALIDVAEVSDGEHAHRTCMRELFLPGARMTPIRKEQDGSFAPRMLTVDDWIKAVRSHGGAPFYEHQVKVKSETYGHFAHLWSTYEILPTPDGKPEVIGINSIQAVFDGSRWRVLNVLWESDATAGPVPKEYLP